MVGFSTTNNSVGCYSCVHIKSGDEIRHLTVLAPRPLFATSLTNHAIGISMRRAHLGIRTLKMFEFLMMIPCLFHFISATRNFCGSGRGIPGIDDIS